MDDKRDLKDASIKERIAALTNFLPLFEAERFSPGQWKSGVSSLPWYEFSAEVSQFIETVERGGWIKPFDWPKWQKEAERFVNEPEHLANGSVQDIEKLLTTHMRKERFCEGHIDCMFECGHIVGTLRRLERIMEELK